MCHVTMLNFRRWGGEKGEEGKRGTRKEGKIWKRVDTKDNGKLFLSKKYRDFLSYLLGTFRGQRGQLIMPSVIL